VGQAGAEHGGRTQRGHRQDRADQRGPGRDRGPVQGPAGCPAPRPPARLAARTSRIAPIALPWLNIPPWGASGKDGSQQRLGVLARTPGSASMRPQLPACVPGASAEDRSALNYGATSLEPPHHEISPPRRNRTHQPAVQIPVDDTHAPRNFQPPGLLTTASARKSAGPLPPPGRHTAGRPAMSQVASQPGRSPDKS